MAEFDYEVVNGRKIRVRPQEVVSEIDENGYFVRQPTPHNEYADLYCSLYCLQSR